jgi:hypothetical protein
VSTASALLKELFQHLRRMDVGAKQKNRSFDAVQHTFTDSGSGDQLCIRGEPQKSCASNSAGPRELANALFHAELLWSIPSTLVNTPIRI